VSCCVEIYTSFISLYNFISLDRYSMDVILDDLMATRALRSFLSTFTIQLFLYTRYIDYRKQQET
jgi:hypothetical protein